MGTASTYSTTIPRTCSITVESCSSAYIMCPPLRQSMTMGRIYIVHAAKPTMEQFNQSIERTFSTNGSMSYVDSMMISQDPTYMLTSSIVEAYSPDGSLLWSRDIGRNAIRPFIDEQVWPYYNTLRLFDDDRLYVTVDGGIVEIGPGRNDKLDHLCKRRPDTCYSR